MVMLYAWAYWVCGHSVPHKGTMEELQAPNVVTQRRWRCGTCLPSIHDIKVKKINEWRTIGMSCDIEEV